PSEGQGRLADEPMAKYPADRRLDARHAWWQGAVRLEILRSEPSQAGGHVAWLGKALGDRLVDDKTRGIDDGLAGSRLGGEQIAKHVERRQIAKLPRGDVQANGACELTLDIRRQEAMHWRVGEGIGRALTARRLAPLLQTPRDLPYCQSGA